MANAMQKLFRRFVLRESNKKGTFTDFCGIRITQVGEGEAWGEVHVCANHLNPYGVVHGGVYVTMMDQVAGVAAVSRGYTALTVSSEMRYLSSARDGVLLCHAKELRMGRTLSVIETEVRTGQGETVALGTYTFRVKPFGRKKA